ncbi:MAG: magnetosome protein MamI [Alphaproteobacteria bacterium]
MPIVIFGLLAISLGLWGMAAWWWSVTEILRGLIPIILLILGIVSLAAGLSKVRGDHGTDQDILKDQLKEQG